VLSVIGGRFFEEFSKIPPASALKPDFWRGAGQGAASGASGMAGKILWFSWQKWFLIMVPKVLVKGLFCEMSKFE